MSLVLTDRSKVARSPLARAAWFVSGWVSVVLGGLGVVLPGLPATGFFVAVAGCFPRSSPRFEEWVLNLPVAGPLVRDYRAGLGMPRKAKITALIVMWTAIGISTGLIIEPRWVRVAVVLLGAAGSYVILIRTPTKPPSGSV